MSTLPDEMLNSLISIEMYWLNSIGRMDILIKEF